MTSKRYLSWVILLATVIVLGYTRLGPCPPLPPGDPTSVAHVPAEADMSMIVAAGGIVSYGAIRLYKKFTGK